METNSSEKTKSFFDVWVDSQKQMMDNWNAAKSKVQDNLSANEAIEKGADFYKKWLDSQLSFFNKAAENVTKAAETVTNGTNAPAPEFNEFYKNWVSSQMNITQKWVEMNQEMMNKVMNTNSNPLFGDSKKNFDSMMSMYNNWTGSFKTPYAEMMKNMTSGSGKDAFAGMMNFTETYSKMMEIWAPMYKAMQDNSFSKDSFAKFFNPSQYKEVMDQMFNFSAGTEQMMKFYDYSSKMMGNLQGAQNFGKDYFNQMKSFAGEMKNLSAFDFNSMTEFYKNLSENISSGLSPFIKMMTPGRDRDQIEKMGEMMDTYALYSVKYSQMQYLVYTTGQKAFEKLAESSFEKFKNGNTGAGFTEFFNEWLNINDSVFVELFKTDEYSRLQGEITSLGFTLKKEMDKQMEMSFSFLPLIPRSEMDELYKTVYELKKKVRSLEKEVEAKSAKTTVAESKAEETKTASSSAKKSGKNA